MDFIFIPVTIKMESISITEVLLCIQTLAPRPWDLIEAVRLICGLRPEAGRQGPNSQLNLQDQTVPWRTAGAPETLVKVLLHIFWGHI